VMADLLQKLMSQLAGRTLAVALRASRGLASLDVQDERCHVRDCIRHRQLDDRLCA